MKALFAFAIVLLCLTFTFGQNEQAPILEKEINYKNWTFRNIRTGAESSLRELSAGKKLVAVVYFAPWCGNWRHDAPILERLYQKYKSSGFEIIAVGEYGDVSEMRTNLDTLKVTFPAYYESEQRTDKQKTTHYDYRKETGDSRNWGSPWYIFLDPAAFPAKGDVLTRKTFIINGEMIEAEGEKFIRERLGLSPAEAAKLEMAKSEIEPCEADSLVPALKRP